ncbi:hypothetical protein HGM15179_011168 [Zosterops borbonicus]|uniref:Uncharacterized protein n=1 Tax=Zosterops borbonicus TaxID=364589 RepID=A0A8K1LJA3_9PASS|nr:hypothetical protein HGM15179_011168 [Zosterops borbonicus]
MQSGTAAPGDRARYRTRGGIDRDPKLIDFFMTVPQMDSCESNEMLTLHFEEEIFSIRGDFSAAGAEEPGWDTAAPIPYLPVVSAPRYRIYPQGYGRIRRYRIDRH